LKRLLLDPLGIAPFSFVFLTATEESIVEMRKAGIDPIVIIENPVKNL
jgi:hypothetical protein